MGWVEQAIRSLTQRTEYLFRLLDQYRQQDQNARQQLLAAFQSSGSGGGGTASAGYYCTVPAVGGPFTATWSGGAPVSAGSFAATVFQVSGGTVTNLGSFTIRNWFPAGPVLGLVIQVFPDGSGGYVTGPQSCS